VLPLATVPVEVLSSHHDWLGYVAALGGLAGGIAGVAALIFANRSAEDAKRSATAAEKTAAIAERSLTIMREEAEVAREMRSRKAEPVLILSAEVRGTMPDAPPTLVILTLGFRNEGNRVADRLMVNFLVPDNFNFIACDQEGNPTPDAGHVATTSEQLGDHIGAKYWWDEVGPLLARSVNKLQHLLINRPPPGEHVLKGVLMNEDLPGNERSWRWQLSVPEAGQRLMLTELEPS
jgi:hypothetical protein